MVKIHPAPPYRLDLTVAALRRLPVNSIDRWDGKTYRRVFTAGEVACEIQVEQTSSVLKPELKVRVEGVSFGAEHKTAILPAIGKLLGTGVDLEPFYRLTASNPGFAKLADEFIGLKPPRFPSIFETLVNGYACQQLSLHVGITLLTRLAASFGVRHGEFFAFPRPKDIAGKQPSELKNLGFSGRKAEHIINLARRIESGDLDLEALDRLDDRTLIDRLQEISGIGRWSAEYAALRGYGRLDVFPGDDVGGQSKLQRWLDLKERPGYEQIQKLLKPCAPYRGLVYFLLSRYYHGR